MNIFKKLKEGKIEDILKEWAAKNIKVDEDGYVIRRKPTKKLRNIICSLSKKYEDDKEVVRLWEEATQRECLRDWIDTGKYTFKLCSDYDSCEECDIRAIEICKLMKESERK